MIRKTLIALPLFLVITTLTMSFREAPSLKGRKKTTVSSVNCVKCANVFDDGVEKHRMVTKNSALKAPLRNQKHIRRYVANSQLAPLKSGNGYMVAKMTYSYPYLTVKAVDFVEQLSLAYRQACQLKGIPFRPFIITSALRTSESVSRLTKVNGNAIRESAHLYGTTFDISWFRFGRNQAPSQRNLDALVSVLTSFREAGACFVKYEKQQACFHITVNEAASEVYARN
jgi:uncharacterized protein YcbK (DUF882 family)